MAILYEQFRFREQGPLQVGAVHGPPPLQALVDEPGPPVGAALSDPPLPPGAIKIDQTLLNECSMYTI